ncbi:cation efflux system protein [Synergistales bacterium]|nr:cation efflux system protein [Synergistales bacterium]
MMSEETLKSEEALDADKRTQDGMSVTLLGLGINVVLTVGKYAAGFLGNSGAMLADATHSLSDLLTDLAVILGLSYTNRPADEDHAYGHGRFETLSAAFCGLVLFLVGIGIFFEGSKSIMRSLQGETLPYPGMVALWAAVVSILFKETLFHVTFAKGEKLDSPSLKANAWHHRSDAMSSVGALLGIGGSIVGGDKWAVLDPIAAVLVSAFILYAAISISWGSIKDVLDTSLAPEQLNLIERTALAFPEILDIHKIRTRRIGFYAALEAHILMDGKLSLKRSHDVTEALEDSLKAILGKRSLITLHTEPYESQTFL